MFEKEFGGKTVITSLMLPVYLRIFETVTPNVPPLTDDMFINMLCHILVISIGQAILFNVNASSGGLDVVAKVLNKYLHFEIGKSLTIAGFVTVKYVYPCLRQKDTGSGASGNLSLWIVLDNFSRCVQYP